MFWFSFKIFVISISFDLFKQMSVSSMNEQELEALLTCAPGTPLSERIRVFEEDQKFNESNDILKTLTTLRSKLPRNTPASNEVSHRLCQVGQLINARIMMLDAEREELRRLVKELVHEKEELDKEQARIDELQRALNARTLQYNKDYDAVEGFIRSLNAKERPEVVERMVNAAMADIRATPVAEAPEVEVHDEPTSKSPRPPHSDHQERREERSRSRHRSEARQSRPRESQAARSRGNSPRK